MQRPFNSDARVRTVAANCARSVAAVVQSEAATGRNGRWRLLLLTTDGDDDAFQRAASDIGQPADDVLRTLRVSRPRLSAGVLLQIRRIVPLLTRLAGLVVIGWASGVVGLWSSGIGFQDSVSERSVATTGGVVYAASMHQYAEATPTAAPAGAPQAPPDVEPAPPEPSPSPIPYTGEFCFGDEQVTFVPEDPRTNSELLIAVTSRYENKYPRLAGTEKASFVRMRPGQLGYVWEWTIQTTWPGQHQYVFYVDSTIPCKKIDVLVKQQYLTPTPKPTETPKPEDYDNDGGDSDNDEGD